MAIFKCAGCGSEITAEEKFKPLKDGGFNRYVYYHCTRQVNYDCRERFINEKDLIEKIISYIKEHSKEIEVTNELEQLANRHAEVVRCSLSARGLDMDKIRPYRRILGVYPQGRYLQGARASDRGLSVLKVRSAK